MSTPEVWLRGPVADVSRELQPVAHALLQAVEDVQRLVPSLRVEDVWLSPGGAASVGFHLLHMRGSLERLLTYARGEPLSAEQRAALAEEGRPSTGQTAPELVARFAATVEEALSQLRATSVAELDAARAVGAARLPSSVRGLLFHAAEHTARHAGQISTTVKVVHGTRAGG